MAELDPEKVKRAKALKMKLELEAKAKEAEGYKPASPTTEDTSWWDTLKNTAINAPGSAINVGKSLVDVVSHPVQTMEGIRALDRGSRQWLDSLVGDVPETPELAAWRKLGSDIYEGVKHPAITFSNDPAGVLMDILGAKGIGGKALRMTEAPTDLPRLIEKSKGISDAAFAETNKLGKTDLSTIIPEVRAAAKGAGYDPLNFPAQAQARPGLENVLTKFDKPSTVQPQIMADPRTVRNIRGKESGLEDLQQNVGQLSRDDGIIQKSKAAFDEGIRKVNPALADAIEAENAAYGLYKTNRGLSDMLTSGQLRGALRGEDASEIKKNITRALTNARTKKGYGDIVDELTTIVTKTPNSSGLMRSMLTQSGASSSVGALLGSKFGPLGAVVGALGGASVPPILRLRRNAKAARIVERDLKNLIREINGLPPAQRTLRIQQLSPGERAALIGAGVVGQDEQ